MSIDEVRREHKELEGDPQVRSRRRQLHREANEVGMLSGVRKASVVVVNPTHIAVALYYEAGETDLPVVLAKGEGELARAIRKSPRRKAFRSFTTSIWRGACVLRRRSINTFPKSSSSRWQRCCAGRATCNVLDPQSIRVESAMVTSVAAMNKLNGSPWRLLMRQHDLLLALLIVAVIALMILPLPPFMLDTLIALNLSLSVILLMVSLYISSPLGLSTFPSLLLFTTLFRLSLNIAATRQILLHADAGDIIFTFGNLVVGGDIIVGIVVFLIIAIVQFIVIAKGAERVAEVGARFTLDAMPGKQMSIDADLRAGLIDKEEARTRRSLLERESHLYGAMDGAMKFVKGDAIAALIIAAVNIIAGLSVGTLRKGMDLGTALDTYSVLTVGDALVSQIPSLFVSIAAGVLITRVADPARKQGEGLGGEIAEQIRAHPRALLIAAVVVTGLILVPGFPKLQFFALAAASWLCRLLVAARKTTLRDAW